MGIYNSTTINSTITHIFTKPKPGAEDEYSFHRYATFDEIREQILDLLKTIHVPSMDGNAYDSREWLNKNDDIDLSQPCGSGQICFIPRQGSSEGVCFDVIHFESGKQGQHTSIMTGKYFCDDDDIWMITRALTEAVEQGYYLNKSIV